MPHSIKQHDARTLRWEVNGDLTGATAVKLYGAERATGTPTLDKTATVFSAGAVSLIDVALSATDTATPGVLLIEVQATFPGSVVTTFPSRNYDTLTIVADIG